MSKDLVCKKEEIKSKNLIKQYKKRLTLIDYVAHNENIKEHNPNWLQLFDHPYRTLMIEGFGLGKTNALLNLINQNTIF